MLNQQWIYKKTGKEATPEFIEGATNSFAVWWLGTIEQIKKLGN